MPDAPRSARVTTNTTTNTNITWAQASSRDRHNRMFNYDLDSGLDEGKVRVVEGHSIARDLYVVHFCDDIHMVSHRIFTVGFQAERWHDCYQTQYDAHRPEIPVSVSFPSDSLEVAKPFLPCGSTGTWG